MLTEEEIDFMEFVENTLVPDLKNSGSECTAEDFERLLAIIDRLRGAF